VFFHIWKHAHEPHLDSIFFFPFPLTYLSVSQGKGNSGLRA
jgi:hypothetical protein